MDYAPCTFVRMAVKHSAHAVPWITGEIYSKFVSHDPLYKALYHIVIIARNSVSVEDIHLRHWHCSWRIVSMSKIYICLLDLHHLDSWIKRDQLDVTCFFISLFNAQHVSDVNTSILKSLRLICWVISWVVLLWYDVCWCYVVVWLGWCGIRMQAEALVL